MKTETDRELLELAAKAAGYTSHGYGEMVCGSPMLYLKDADFTGMWAPLTDDGDALRLAMKLDLLVIPHPLDNAVRVVDSDAAFVMVPWGTPPDKLSATRYAIVRAAAFIGKAMK